MKKPHSTDTPSLHQAVPVGENIFRLTAPNPGPMTASGTNTYLIGSKGRFMVVDPGPAIDSHINAILDFVGGAGQIARILVTHMHPDHSPAAAPLAALSGAPIHGWSPVEDEYQDTTCQPTHRVKHDEILELDGLRLRCIHTPGHVDNHVCYLYENGLYENGQILMTGDHIMQGSTVVIIPPHGKMKEYIASLQLLNNYPLRLLAPGHGEMITSPHQEIDRLVKHRMAREAKVLDGLARLAVASIDQLTEVVYNDVDRSLHHLANLSLLAHLIKLQEENRVSRQGDKWRLEK